MILSDPSWDKNNYVRIGSVEQTKESDAHPCNQCAPYQWPEDQRL